MRGGKGRTAYRGFVSLVFALVGLTLFYIWLKVELGTVARQLQSAEIWIARLEKERTKLAVDIVQKKKLGIIQKKAERDLGMIYPEDGPIDLGLDHVAVD